MLEIKKMDGRHTGFPEFTYYAKTYNFWHFKDRSNQNLFFEIREWCWQTWGPSKEIKEWLLDTDWQNNNTVEPKCHNEHWCWEYDGTASRIFFRTEKELVLFKLRWM